jgi:arginase
LNLPQRAHLPSRLIQVPYDLGRRDFRMGLGPAHLIKHATDLRDVATERIEIQEQPFEIGTTFEVLSSLSKKVKGAVELNHLPLVLAGSCISSVGTLAGLGHEPVAVVWLDAHGDFNTPDTSPTGFLDGMALAAVTGRCWRTLTATIDGFRRVPEEDVILIGARDLDPEEHNLLRSSKVSWIQTAALRENGVQRALTRVLDELKPKRIYLHIDLDVLDVSEARVNQYSSSGGLTFDELLDSIRLCAAAKSISAAAITAYDPSYDTDGRALRAGTAVVRELCGTIASA